MNELTTTEPRSALGDLRSNLMALSVEQIQAGLAEYSERRKTFRDWIREQLVEGLHYGYPPGCEPKTDENGNILQWQKNGYVAVPKSQWQAKPSLYKAGADFVCDLLAARDEYEADESAWHQLGSPKGTFVMTCRLFSRQSGDIIDEGRGVCKVGEKKMNENAALKMAKKRAKVDAVLNAWGLSDLFTQDLEDLQPHANPKQSATAPTAQPRGERGDDKHPMHAACKSLYDQWVKHRKGLGLEHHGGAFAAWVNELRPNIERVADPASWTDEDIEVCHKALKAEQPPEPAAQQGEIPF